MSIYVSIPCLDIDQEIIKTIRSAKDNARNQDEIIISVAFIGNESFFNYVKNETKGYSNLILNYYPFDKNNGVGMSRYLAASKHTNEKYFLQVDAHTFFLQDWDHYLIKKFNKIKRKIKKDKIILSCLPGAYLYYNKNEVEDFNYSTSTSYPQYVKNKFLMDSPDNKPIVINGKSVDKFIPTFQDMSYEFLCRQTEESLLINFKKNDFAPLHKISAAFLFTDSFIQGNTFVEKDAYFWEEEITQSINLVGNGFSLVYAGETLPIMHFYLQYMFNNKGNRTSLSSIMKDDMEFYQNRILDNWLSFILDKKNIEKIKKYEKYSNINLIDGPSSEWFLPKDYSG
jgi:hypothetical protein